MAQQLEQAKQMKAMALLNMRGEGIMLKRLPITMLKKCGDPDAVVNAVLQQTCARKTALGWNQAVMGWGRDGLNGQYLDDLLGGLPYVKHPNVYVAIKAARPAAGGAYQTRVVGLVVYGTFNPDRVAEGRRWAIDINEVAANRVAAGRVAEIEGVIVEPQSRGIGKALVEWAVADIASRRKGGQPRYTDVVLNTTNAVMEGLAQNQFGFVNRGYRLMEDGVNRRNALIQNQVADDARWKHLRFTQASLAALLASARNRVVSTNACPPGRGGLKMWPACR